MKHGLFQFLRYTSVGAVNTALNWGVYFGLTRLTVVGSAHPVWSNGIATVLGFVSSYALNKSWTYGDRSPVAVSQIAKFLLIVGSGIAIGQVLFALGLRYGISDVVLKVILVALGGVWNFTGHKVWTFAQQ